MTPSEPLTPREKEVLAILIYGRTAQEAAAVLSISFRTVEGHRANILKKYGVRKIAELTGVLLPELTQSPQAENAALLELLAGVRAMQKQLDGVERRVQAILDLTAPAPLSTTTSISRLAKLKASRRTRPSSR